MGKKIFKTLDEQVEILKNKGLVIDNVDYAKEILLRENYFFLNGYRHLFMKSSDNSMYIPGTKIEELYSLFLFDRKIRNIFFKNILIVENNVKSIISYQLSKKYGYKEKDYLNPNNFVNNGAKRKQVSDLISKMKRQIKTNAVTPLQGNQADIVDAQIKARKGQYKEALELLDTVNTLTLSQDSVKFYYVLKGNVYAKLNNQVGAATNYLEAAKYYDGQEKTDLYKRANDYLIQSSTKDIYAAFKVNKNQIDRGFFEYALIQKSKNTNSRYKQLERFEKKYPKAFDINTPMPNYMELK